MKKKNMKKKNLKKITTKKIEEEEEINEIELTVDEEIDEAMYWLKGIKELIELRDDWKHIQDKLGYGNNQIDQLIKEHYEMHEEDGALAVEGYKNFEEVQAIAEKELRRVLNLKKYE